MDYVTIINYLFIHVKYWNKFPMRILTGNLFIISKEYNYENLIFTNYNLLCRFADTHEMVNRALNITLKCFEECNVQLFNDIASSAINIIYKVS